jgi:hypothetical protein
MNMTKSSVLLLFLLTSKFLVAQDKPVSCGVTVSSFDDIMKGKITSQVRNAHNYYMNSNDPSVGRTYEERTANLNKEITKTFQAFMTAR